MCCCDTFMDNHIQFNVMVKKLLMVKPILLKKALKVIFCLQ